MKLVRYLLLILLLCESFYAVAQKKSGAVIVTVLCRSDVQLSGQKLYSVVAKSDGLTEYLYGLTGAVAILKHNGDTVKYTMADNDGICVFKNIPYGKYALDISHIGYESFKTELEHTTSKSTVDAFLSESGLLLESIKVKGSIPLVIKRGDTLVVNPAAVQTKQGAAAIEIIKQVPGIELEEGGGLTIYGEPLRRSYVGGSTLFGTGVLTALKNIDAELVKNIKFYDEDEYAGVVNGRVESRKVKVMNIETTKQLLSSLNGHLFAGVGKDLKNGESEERLRYKGGTSFNLFSDKFMINADAYMNNVGLSSSMANYQSALLSGKGVGERRLAAANVQLSYLKGDAYKEGSALSLGYAYNFNEYTNESIQSREYFPNESYQWRRYASEQTYSSIGNAHNVSLGYRKNGGEKFAAIFTWDHLMQFEDNENNSYTEMYDASDKLETFVSDTSFLKEKNWVISESLFLLTAMKTLSSVNANISFGKNDGSSIRTVDENGMERVFESSPIGEHFNAAAQVDFNLLSFKFKSERSNGYINGGINIRYNKAKKKHFRYDIADGTTTFDESNSYHYSNNNWENLFFVRASLTPGRRASSGIVKANQLKFGVKQVLISDVNRLFDNRSKKSYYLPEGDLSLNFGDFGISYSVSSSVPSLEQLREYVDDTNPLYLRVGNPNLKASYLHALNLQYNKGYSFSDVSYWNLYLKGSIRQNSVAPYNVYYVESTELPIGEGYKVQPGVTVESYKNVKNEKEVDLAFNYSNRFPAIKTKFTLYTNGRYSTRYSYVQDILNETDTYAAQLMLETYTSYKWMNLKLRSSTGYTFSANSAKNNYEYFNQYLQATLEVTLFNVWNIGAGYNLVFNKPLGTTQSIINRNNILNATTGVTLFKGRLTAGISVFDIFDSSTDFTTMLYSDYIQNSWTATFGRYISFDVVFNLRKSRFKE